ncbi:hypothetical protein F5887DRAFT_922107 [Amanita rubescens]|nr:hypothetical protein F5887DRAFT_922107 [Amanita rubescens]
MSYNSGQGDRTNLSWTSTSSDRQDIQFSTGKTNEHPRFLLRSGPFTSSSVQSPPKEDDTWISMIGGGQIRRNSVASVIRSSPCARVEKRKKMGRRGTDDQDCAGGQSVEEDFQSVRMKIHMYLVQYQFSRGRYQQAVLAQVFVHLAPGRILLSPQALILLKSISHLQWIGTDSAHMDKVTAYTATIWLNFGCFIIPRASLYGSQLQRRKRVT